MGSSRHIFRMFLHIGAHITWVLAKDSNIPYWDSRQKFDPNESNTKQQLKKVFDHNYGKCHVAGTVVVDTLEIGKMELGRIQFGLVTSVLNPHLLTEDVDGFLGLGPQALITSFKRTIMDYMSDRKLIECRKFGFIFKETLDSTNYLVLGDDVEAHVRGELLYVDCTSPTIWQTELTKIMVGEQTVYVGTRSALFDTLYKSVVLPSEFAKKINEFLGLTGNVGPFTTMDCKSKLGWPNITFSFGSTQLVLRSHQYLAQISQDGQEHCVSIFTGADPIAFPFIILGMSFISKFDTVFDLELMRIGFASPGQ